MAHTIASALQWVAYGFVPWWLYIMACVPAVVAIMLYVPGKLGILLSVTAVLILGGTGFAALGYTWGEGHERAKWEAQVAAEKERLRQAFDKGRAAEQTRQWQAQQEQEQLQKATDDISQEADKVPGATDVVVPEPIARRLYDLRGRR